MKRISLGCLWNKAFPILTGCIALMLILTAIYVPSRGMAESEAAEMLVLTIDNVEIPVDWESNDSVEALKVLVAEQPLTVQMSMYGGFEQVGSLGSRLPRNDTQTNTGHGDIVLYSGNQIVIFYGSNSWAYTRLGHIPDKTQAEMRDLLGQHDVTVTLSLRMSVTGTAYSIVSMPRSIRKSP